MSAPADFKDSPLNARPHGATPERRRIPTLAVSITEACEALGISHAYWQEHVAGEIKIVRRGRRKMVAIVELQAWLDANGERTLERRS